MKHLKTSQVFKKNVHLEFGQTFRALSRACSSSRAACFSRSSTLVKDIPVLAKDDTAFDRVLALHGGKE